MPSKEMSLRPVALSGFLVLAAKAAATAGNLVVQVLFARLMPFDAFASFVLIQVLATLLSLFAGLGLPFVGVRIIPAALAAGRPGKAEAFVRVAWRGTLGSATGLAAVMVGLFAALPDLRPELGAAALAAPLVHAFAATSLAATILLAMGWALLGELLSNLLRPVVCAVLVAGHGSPLGLTEALIALVGSAILGAAVTAAAAHRLRHRAPSDRREPGEFKEWLNSGLALLLVLGASALMERADILMLGALRDRESAALYSVASRIALLLNLAAQSANAVVMPRAAAALGAAADGTAIAGAARSGTGLHLGLAVLCAAPLVVGGHWILGVFGPSFIQAYPALLVLLVGQLASAAAGLTAGSWLFAAGKNRTLSLVQTGSLALNILLNLILIPPFGMLGAACATAVANLVNALALATAARRSVGIETSIAALLSARPGGSRQ